MSFRGWVNTSIALSNHLAPHCPQCNRKMRSGVKCRLCKTKCCSQNCFHRHINTVHSDLVEKQRFADRQREQQRRVADIKQAVMVTLSLEEQAHKVRRERIEAEQLAEQKAEEKARQLRMKVAKDKQEKLDRTRQELAKAAEYLENCYAAWQMAGSITVCQAEVDKSFSTLRKIRVKLKHEKRKASFTIVKILYLRLSNSIRDVVSRYNVPIFALIPIFAALSFALTVVIVVPFAKGHKIPFSLGGVGFLIGAVLMSCFIFLPSNDEIEPSLNSLKDKQQKDKEAKSEVMLAYSNARDEHENLFELRQLLSECEKATQRKLSLEEEYQSLLVN